MQYQIPQFIEVEDKIFGPLTFKQFLYLVGGGGLSFVLYKILPVFIAVLVIVPFVLLSLALAFYKVNNKSFISLLESAFKYISGARLYIWKKEDKKPVGKIAVEKNSVEQIQIPRLSDSKLKDIAWSLGVKESMYASQVEEKNV